MPHLFTKTTKRKELAFQTRLITKICSLYTYPHDDVQKETTTKMSPGYNKFEQLVEETQKHSA